MKKLLIVCLIVFLLISPVAAQTHTITVDEKKIMGSSSTASANYICIVGKQHATSNNGVYWEEYVVSIEDYDKIEYGSTITLERDGMLYKLVKVTNDIGW